MKSKRTLMTVLVGLAMLATPIAAAAKDHGRNAQYNAPRVSRSFVAPARNFGPVVVNKHEFRNSQAWTPAPVAVARHEWKGNGWKGQGWKNGVWGGDGDADDYQNYGYGNPGYVAAPVYAAPAYQMAAPYYGGGYGNSCRAAQSIVTNYWRDRNTGHPAAAADMLRKNQWAFRSGCAGGGGSPYNGGLLGELGALGGYGGAPAYSNYGGYNSGYNGGYNGGYGQPYGGTSMLAPLIQQFVR